MDNRPFGLGKFNVTQLEDRSAPSSLLSINIGIGGVCNGTVILPPPPPPSDGGGVVVPPPTPGSM